MGSKYVVIGGWFVIHHRDKILHENILHFSRRKIIKCPQVVLKVAVDSNKELGRIIDMMGLCYFLDIMDTGNNDI